MKFNVFVNKGNFDIFFEVFFFFNYFNLVREVWFCVGKFKFFVYNFVKFFFFKYERYFI